MKNFFKLMLLLSVQISINLNSAALELIQDGNQAEDKQSIDQTIEQLSEELIKLVSTYNRELIEHNGNTNSGSDLISCGFMEISQLSSYEQEILYNLRLNSLVFIKNYYGNCTQYGIMLEISKKHLKPIAALYDKAAQGISRKVMQERINNLDAICKRLKRFLDFNIFDFNYCLIKSSL